MPEDKNIASLMAGKKGLIMGVANDHSIAWGMADQLHQHGAELAFTYQGEALGKRVLPLAESIGSKIVLPCDVTEPRSIDATFDAIGQVWQNIDFIVHAIAYSDKEELKGKYIDTSRDNFLHTLEVSCYSFTAIAQKAASKLKSGSSILTLTYDGSQRVMPNYNVMGVAKAALEASVKYLANDLGPTGIRVNAISAGPMRTLAGSAIGSARFVFKWQGENSPLRRNVTLKNIGDAGVYLLSDLASAVTGETLYVDCGYNALGMASSPP